MDDRAQILFCLQKIEEKLRWKPHSEWKDHEFKQLKKYIQESSGISISTHTLKRLFGKIRYRSNYNPQHATKDALAIFLGYESWERFVRENQEEIHACSRSNQQDKPVSPNRPRGRIKLGKASRSVLFGIPVILIVLLIVWFGLRIYRSDPGKFEFTAGHNSGVIPHTVTFRFDLTSIRPGQLMIDFDYTHPRLGQEFIVTDKTRTFLNHTYQVPGVYRPGLIWNNKIVDSVLVVAKTDGWVSFYHAEDETERYWLDNMYQNLPYRRSLTFPRKLISAAGKDTGLVYYTTHRNIRDFGASGDNFTWSAAFSNNPGTGGITCFDCRFTVFGEHSHSLVEFVEHNCHRYCRIKFGEEELAGDFHDLSALTFDPENGNRMTMEVRDKQAVISLNGRVVYELDYQVSTGSIKGLEVFFKGSGSVDRMTLTGGDADTVYHEIFNPDFDQE